MSSDDEECDLNYGLDDEYGKSFGKSKTPETGKEKSYF